MKKLQCKDQDRNLLAEKFLLVRKVKNNIFKQFQLKYLNMSLLCEPNQFIRRPDYMMKKQYSSLLWVSSRSYRRSNTILESPVHKSCRRQFQLIASPLIRLPNNSNLLAGLQCVLSIQLNCSILLLINCSSNPIIRLVRASTVDAIVYCDVYCLRLK